MNSRIILIAVVVLLVLGAGVFLLTKNNSTTSMTAQPTPTEAMMVEETPTAAPSEASPSGTPEVSGAMTEESGATKTITVTGSSFKFDPTTITVKKGDKVNIVFKNAGGMHDFVLDEFNVSTKVLQAGQEETVSFVADKAGTYEYYCSVGNHRQMGMVGKLIVQ